MGGRGVYRWIAPHEAMPGMYGLGVRFVEGYAEKTILDDFRRFVFTFFFGGSYFFSSTVALSARVMAHTTQKNTSCRAMYGSAVVFSVRFGAAGRQSRPVEKITLFPSRWTRNLFLGFCDALRSLAAVHWPVRWVQ